MTGGRGESFPWKEKVALVTGGTGSFGRRCVEILRGEQRPRRLIVFSRDEQKQHEMQQLFPAGDSLRYVIGDIRDVDRLRNAFDEVDIVVHAAAMKQIPTCEYNAFEAIQTNVIGARNIIAAALDRGVERVLNLSTDKSVNPVGVYGATKFLAEKLFLEASASREGRPPLFSTVRYGNVIGTRGSVIPIFRRQRQNGVVTVTDPRMTRFWITRDQGVRFVIQCVEKMQGGEIFVPKVPSAGVMDLVETVAPGCRVEYIGIRHGEKLHEILISDDEARYGLEFADMFVVRPSGGANIGREWSEGKPLPDGYRYTSDGTARRLSLEELKALVEEGDESMRRAADAAGRGTVGSV
jgi:UDP-N-acetylglucosamine 4,6-dehydratase